jgi:hypothetical protein
MSRVPRSRKTFYCIVLSINLTATSSPRPPDDIQTGQSPVSLLAVLDDCGGGGTTSGSSTCMSNL